MSRILRFFPCLFSTLFSVKAIDHSLVEDIKKKNEVFERCAKENFDAYYLIQVKQVKYLPYLTYSYIFPKQMMTNEWGFRVPYSFDRIPKKTKKRILVLGGSSAFGTGVKNVNDTLTGIMSEELQQEYEVINLAMPGYVSMSELILFEFIGYKFDPDIMLLFNGLNDITLAESERYTKRQADYPYMHCQTQKRIEMGDTKLRLVERIRLLRRLRNWIRRAWEMSGPSQKQAQVNDNARNYSAIDTYLKNIKCFIGLSKVFDFKLIVATQPTALYNYTRNNQDESTCLKGSVPTYVEPVEYENVTRKYPLLVEKLKKLNEERQDFEHIDLTGVFNGIKEDKLIWFDYAHFTNLGHRIVGEQICRESKYLNGSILAKV